jgi:AraC-like DNA-binding protein
VAHVPPEFEPHRANAAQDASRLSRGSSTVNGFLGPCGILRTIDPRLTVSEGPRTFTKLLKQLGLRLEATPREVRRLATLRLVPLPRVPSLFSRLRFDPSVEAQAFRQLAGLELTACRASFARLVGDLDLAGSGASDREIILLLTDILQRVNRRLHRPPDGDEACQANRAALLTQFAAHESAVRAREDFLATLERLLAVLETPAKTHPLIERARTFIDENYQRRLSLSAIARALHVSPNYLSRIVRRETGVTLTTQIHLTRLEHARLLLAGGGRSISEIAYTVGYQNYRDFYRNFVKYEHATPRQARRSMSRVEDLSSVLTRE